MDTDEYVQVQEYVNEKFDIIKDTVREFLQLIIKNALKYVGENCERIGSMLSGLYLSFDNVSLTDKDGLWHNLVSMMGTVTRLGTDTRVFIILASILSHHIPLAF